MKILTLDNKAFDLNELPEEVEEDARFSVLDNSDPKNPDFFFQPLIFLESFNSPAILMKLGGFEVKMPLDWSILVGDSEGGSDPEILPLTSINERGFEAFIMNPIKGYKFDYCDIEIINIDAELYGSDHGNLSQIENSNRYEFFKGNISNKIVGRIQYYAGSEAGWGGRKGNRNT